MLLTVFSAMAYPQQIQNLQLSNLNLLAMAIWRIKHRKKPLNLLISNQFRDFAISVTSQTKLKPETYLLAKIWRPLCCNLLSYLRTIFLQTLDLFYLAVILLKMQTAQMTAHKLQSQLTVYTMRAKVHMLYLRNYLGINLCRLFQKFLPTKLQAT